MGVGERRQKDSAMASMLKAAGIWHGRRTTSPMHANYPSLNEIGSAAYRRLVAKRRRSNAA